MIRGDHRPRRSPSVAWQTIDGETVLLRLKEKELLGFNAVGRQVWELADGTCSIDRIVESLVTQHRVPADVARADVLRFIEELTSIGALELRTD
jgi:hypothetical protein